MLPQINNILRQNDKILESNEDIKKIIGGKSRVTFARGENVQDILVHRKHNKKFYKNEERATTKCDKKKCATCIYIKEGSGF